MAAGDGPAPTVALFVTCVVDLVRPQVAVAAVRLLRDAGATVSCPQDQTCCGQPAWNAGFTDEAAAVAGASLDALERDDADQVVVPAGSCATMIRRYWPQLFALAGRPDDAERAERLAPRVVELSELLAQIEPPPPPPPIADTGNDAEDDTQEEVTHVADRGSTFAYQRSCHLERELHIVDQPVALLTAASGQAPAPWEADDRCCGFGGTFSVRLPEVSVTMADHKLDTLPDGVDTVVGCDTSCLLHLEARARERELPLRFAHLAEILAEHGAGHRAERHEAAGDG